MTNELTPEMQQQLLAPFPDNVVGWKPQVTTKGRAKEEIIRNGIRVAGCVAHIDARNVMDRLDETVGVGGWSDFYERIGDRHIKCTLIVLGVSKQDVGQTNEGGFADPVKSAFSDALKRTAVKFGIGRYLYGMPMQWLPYDGYKVTPPNATNHPPPPIRKNKAAPPTGTRQTQADKDFENLPSEGTKKKKTAVSDGDYIKAALASRSWINVANNLVSSGHYRDTAHATGAVQNKYDSKLEEINFKDAQQVSRLVNWLVDRKDSG